MYIIHIYIYIFDLSRQYTYIHISLANHHWEYLFTILFNIPKSKHTNNSRRSHFFAAEEAVVAVSYLKFH